MPIYFLNKHVFKKCFEKNCKNIFQNHFFQRNHFFKIIFLQCWPCAPSLVAHICSKRCEREPTYGLIALKVDVVLGNFTFMLSTTCWHMSINLSFHVSNCWVPYGVAWPLCRRFFSDGLVSVNMCGSLCGAMFVEVVKGLLRVVGGCRRLSGVVLLCVIRFCGGCRARG